MANFEDFFGVDMLLERLRRSIREGSGVHAFLFYGPEGTGKRTLAEICARAINCTSLTQRPCDSCDSCLKYLEKSHPDHTVLTAEKAVKVDDIRELIDKISMQTYEGNYRTVIIEQADTMTQQAQNALLKTLEEPPEKVVIFLVARKLASLLPTIRSRVRLIRFAPLGINECSEVLSRLGKDPLRSRLLAQVAQGSVGKALALDEDEQYWQIRGQVTKALHLLNKQANVSEAFSCIKDYKDHSGEILDMLEQIACVETEAQENDSAERSENAPNFQNIQGFRMLREVFQARRLQESNVAWQSVMETFFFGCLSQDPLPVKNPVR